MSSLQTQLFWQIIHYGEVLRLELTVGGEAAGSAAVLRAVSAVKLQQLRASALRLLRVHVQSREAPDPAVPVVGSRGALGLCGAHQTQDGQEPQRDDHRAIVWVSVTSTWTCLERLDSASETRWMKLCARARACAWVGAGDSERAMKCDSRSSTPTFTLSIKRCCLSNML